MDTVPAELMLDVNDLRPGMYVFLDLSWMEHPFPLNRFTITTPEQIQQIRGLGLKKVKVLPGRSEPGIFATGKPDAEPAAPTGFADSQPMPPPAPAPAGSAAAAAPVVAAVDARTTQRALLDEQNQRLARCERLYGEASTAWRQISTLAQREPVAAMQHSVSMVQGFITELTGGHETSIRLLSEMSGDGGALHALNVTVVSLMLGRALKLDEPTLRDIGIGALLHDIGKQLLPDRLRVRSAQFTAIEERTYRDHVSMGLQIATRMGVSGGAQMVIAQHHESNDGKGYPKGLRAEDLTAAAKVVSLVNAYDNLCNPGNPATASTPHEALSLMFAQIKPRFDPACLTAFIRLMGVYPPGSVVQLNDERFAMVASVNPARPLKPTVLIFDPRVPRDEALLVDLQTNPVLGIRRSLHPRHLSRAALDYLSPRKRMTYFFERGGEATGQGGTAWFMDSGLGSLPGQKGSG